MVEIITSLLVSILLLVFFVTFLVGIILLILFKKDQNQVQHSVLRSHPLLGRFRYLAEKISPEIRQYFVDSDDKQPFSPEDFKTIAKAGKYLSTVMSFGTSRNYDKGGFFLKNVMFPVREKDINVDKSGMIKTKRYVIDKESIFSRKEHIEDHEEFKYLLDKRDYIIIGENTCRHPFEVKSLFGMSGMSYGSLGSNAVTALSMGLGKAEGTWMNTGEGGLSDYHLKGDVDLICQIGPAKFGFRNMDGSFNWEELFNKSRIDKVKAFEIKLGQGAKIRGGKLLGSKVTPEIAEIRGVEPWKTIDSPNRFDEFNNEKELLEFITKIRELTGKPVGIKIVVGGEDSVDELMYQIKFTGMHPDFISVDGGEGGTGSADRSMFESMGLPLKPAVLIINDKLKEIGFRDEIKIIASGKLIHADRIAIMLGLGADLVNIARGFLVTVGCVGSQLCHTGGCPVGVTTNDPNLQKALVIDEKKYRVTNYILTLRKELFALAAACGLDTPAKINEDNIVYVDDNGKIINLDKYKIKDKEKELVG